ncbi:MULTISPECIES: glycosyltransferase family 25 protein [Acinetobacter]|jgi:glycosyl transferase family 25|uniref:glycosyltransferase family 25 protein n=1 Tax=Acinetobacter TaxID=469 RepID=UPI0022E63E0D|nr:MULTISPECIES: glycosyltransferase family 25 protein [Acinetobacter]MDI1224402.1 glycosyltransferase family 25 protein [Acinetobacter sp.]
MKNFVISLKSAKDRRAHILQQFDDKDIPFSFFDAIEPDSIVTQAEKINLTLCQSDLSQNELACLLSHVSLWQKAIDEKIPAIAIFEDDIHLGQDAELFLKDSNWLSYDIVKTEKAYAKVVLDLDKTKVFNNKNFFLRRLRKAHLGAAGYILSYNGAIELVEYLKKQDVFDHVDQMIFRKYISERKLGVYQLTPALCIQDYILNPNEQKFTTSLQWRDQVVSKPTGLQKVLREVSRVFIQLADLPFKTKLEFIRSHKD